MSIKVSLTPNEFASVNDALKNEYVLQTDGTYKLDLGGMYATDKDPAGLMSALEKEREENRLVKAKLNEIETERDAAAREAEMARASKKGDTEALQKLFAEERQKLQDDYKRQVDEANMRVVKQQEAAAEQYKLNQAQKLASELFGKKAALVVPHILKDMNVVPGENPKLEFLNSYGQPDLTMNFEKYKESLSQNEMFGDMIVQTQASGGSANDRNGSSPARSGGKAKAFNDYTSSELVQILQENPKEYERLKAERETSSV